ncbi:MAG: DUF503 domain-containing protein [Acidobacteriota bacterium]
MIIAIASCELHLPEARSLKQKRKVIRSLVDRLHQRFRISVAETDYHDLHQRAEIGVAAVVRDDAAGEQLLDAVRNLIDDQPGAFLTRWSPDLILEASS